MDLVGGNFLLEQCELHEGLSFSEGPFVWNFLDVGGRQLFMSGWPFFFNKRKKVQALRQMLTIAQFPVIHLEPTRPSLRRCLRHVLMWCGSLWGSDMVFVLYGGSGCNVLGGGPVRIFV